MTDKDIVQVLNRIHKMCRKRMFKYEPFTRMCQGCVFEIEKPSKRKNVCQLSMLTGRLSHHPCDWDMGEIGEVIVK